MNKLDSKSSKHLTNILLFGTDSLTPIENVLLFEQIHKFIKESKRFDMG